LLFACLAPIAAGMGVRVTSLQRYPIKGLSAERLPQAELTKGCHFPGDRLYAIENGPSGFDPARPQHQPKIKFLMLMRHEALARLVTRYDDATSTLVIQDGQRELARGDLSTPDGRLAIEAFFRRFMPRELRGAPKVLTAPDESGFRFTDSRRGYVSVINLASVQALEEIAGVPVDPLRFRGNLHVNGMEPWAELDLVGKVLRGPSGLRLKVTKRIERCAATNVNPATGLRDLDLPKTLMGHLGHVDCGIYAEVVDSGTVSEGEELTVEEPAQATLSFN
jgi:uncharacterized protein YcbX